MEAGKLTEGMQQVFLELLGKCPYVAAVCEHLNLTTDEVRFLRKASPEFDDRVKQALEDGRELIEYHAWRRAVEGTKKLSGYDADGNPIENTVYSDRLHAKLLDGNLPKKFNPGRFTLDAPAGQIQMNFNLGGIEELPPEQLPEPEVLDVEED